IGRTSTESTASPCSIVGRDYAGTIVSIGSEVTKSFKVGDKIYGVGHGSNSASGYYGVFAEYAMVKGDVGMHSHKDASPKDLCTIRLYAITAGQGFFQPGKCLGLAMPELEKGNGE
ncbi:hypothetical protein BKA65DRAFT_413799, partial [Rhexocercosporidium sp. MPI-PUGE-AT-0058]